MRIKTRTSTRFTPEWLLYFRIAFTGWMGHFISPLYEGRLHFDLKSQILRIRYPSQSSGRPISHRHEWSFRVAAFTWYRWQISYRRKFSLRYNKRCELKPVWLAPSSHFVVVSYKQIQKHKREPEWTRAAAKVTPVSCKQVCLYYIALTIYLPIG